MHFGTRNKTTAAADEFDRRLDATDPVGDGFDEIVWTLRLPQEPPPRVRELVLTGEAISPQRLNHKRRFVAAFGLAFGLTAVATVTAAGDEPLRTIEGLFEQSRTEVPGQSQVETRIHYIGPESGTGLPIFSSGPHGEDMSLLGRSIGAEAHEIAPGVIVAARREGSGAWAFVELNAAGAERVVHTTSGDFQWAASGTGIVSLVDASVDFVDFATGSVRRVMVPKAGYRLHAVSATGELALVSSGSWDVASGLEVVRADGTRTPLDVAMSGWFPAAFIHDQTVVIAEGNRLTAFSLPGGTQSELASFEDSVTAVVSNGQGTRLAVAVDSMEDARSSWRIVDASGEVLAQLAHDEAFVAWNPGGKSFLVALTLDYINQFIDRQNSRGWASRAVVYRLRSDTGELLADGIQGPFAEQLGHVAFRANDVGFLFSAKRK